MTLAKGTQIGKYAVRRKLAEGGMAEIYLCSARGPEGFEKEVVIKRVRSGLAQEPEFVEMFVHEARLASRLNHANIVQIFDFDRHEDSYYLAMEYVRGTSLWALRKRAKERMEPIPPYVAAQIGCEVARALGYAHRLSENGRPLGLVHRDVTPHNVLLSFDGAVKLADFGIAKAGNRLTAAGVLKGKFAYMSPEQARGDAVDARTDLFALGIVLWECLTKARLFEADSDVGVLRAVQESNIASPRRLNPDVPEALDAVVMRALARDPAARYQTATEFERALFECIRKGAGSLEDSDVGALVHRLFGEELSGAHEEEITDTAPEAPPEMSERKPATVASRGKAEDSKPSGTLVLGSKDASARPVFAGKETPVADAVVPAAEPAGAAKSPRSRWVTVGLGAAIAVAAVAIVARPHAKPAGAAAPVKIVPAMQPTPAPAQTPSPSVAPGQLAPSSTVASAQKTAHDSPPSVAPAKLPPDSTVTAAQKMPAPRPDADHQPAALPVPAKVDAASPPAAPVQPATTASAQKPAADDKSASSDPAGETGTLVLHAKPWASVWIDGHRKDDVMGIHKFHLTPGVHKLRLSQNHGAVERPVKIEAGKEQVVTYDAFGVR